MSSPSWGSGRACHLGSEEQAKTFQEPQDGGDTSEAISSRMSDSRKGPVFLKRSTFFLPVMVHFMCHFC